MVALVSVSFSSPLASLSSFGGLCVRRTSGRTDGVAQQHRCAVIGLSGVCVGNVLAPDDGKAYVFSFLFPRARGTRLRVALAGRSVCGADADRC